MPTTNPATQVAIGRGAKDEDARLLNMSGNSLSRDIANHTRDCPIW